jgi:hypothetical protein
MKIGAGLTISDVTSVIDVAKQVIADVIADGGMVNTDLFNAFPSISEVFDSPDAPFVPALPAGAYHVRIVTQYSSGKFLKVPHTYLFDRELTVN